MHNFANFNYEPTTMPTTKTKRIGIVMSFNSNDLIMKSQESNPATALFENEMSEANHHRQQTDKANESMNKAPNPTVFNSVNSSRCIKPKRTGYCTDKWLRGNRSLILQLKRTILSELSANSKPTRRRIYRQLDSILSDLVDKRIKHLNGQQSQPTRSTESISKSSQAFNELNSDKHCELNSYQLEFQEANPNFMPVKHVQVSNIRNTQPMSESFEAPVVQSVRPKGVKRPMSSCDDETDSHSLSKRVCSEPISLQSTKIQPEFTSHESLFNKEMTEKHLWIITNNYENLSEWKRICLVLGLTIQDVQCIESQYLRFDGLKECFYQSLLRWRMREPENCYLAYFNQVLTFRLGVDSRQTSRLANELIKYEESLKAQTECDPRPSLSQKQLWTSSDLLSKDWKEIARSCLDLKESDISSIERVHLASDGPRECSYQSLLLWSDNLHPKATLNVLCSKLAEHNFKLYARQLLNVLSPRSN